MDITSVKFGDIDLSTSTSLVFDGKTITQIKLGDNVIWPIRAWAKISKNQDGKVISAVNNTLYLDSNTSYVYVEYDSKYQDEIYNVTYTVTKSNGENIASTIVEDAYGNSYISFSMRQSAISSLSQNTKLTFTVTPLDSGNNPIDDLITTFYCIVGDSNTTTPDEEITDRNVEWYSIWADGYGEDNPDTLTGADLIYTITFICSGTNVNGQEVYYEEKSVKGVEYQGAKIKNEVIEFNSKTFYWTATLQLGSFSVDVSETRID